MGIKMSRRVVYGSYISHMHLLKLLEAIENTINSILNNYYNIKLSVKIDLDIMNDPPIAAVSIKDDTSEHVIILYLNEILYDDNYNKLSSKVAA